MLPKPDGITVLSRMRREGIEAPVILLTAKGETEDKVRGFDSGADDYLAKPFQIGELLARLHALGGRKGYLARESILGYANIEPNYNTLDPYGNDR